MITDAQTNLLYLSELLKERSEFFRNFTNHLSKNSIVFKLLPHTCDIWAVDYMPVQTGPDTFVQFRYDPDYLRPKKYRHTKSDPAVICKSIGIQPAVSNLVIDGGNVIRGENWVILTDKIFKENPGYSPDDLVNELERLFDSRVIIIPRQPYDFTGHADGILRYYSNDTVLMNRYPEKEMRTFQKKLERSLKEAGVRTIEIPYAYQYSRNVDHKDQVDGLYINYLHMKDCLLVPTFKLPEDDRILALFEQLFHGYTVEPVDSREISKDGGVLNCISWNVFN